MMIAPAEQSLRDHFFEPIGAGLSNRFRRKRPLSRDSGGSTDVVAHLAEEFLAAFGHRLPPPRWEMWRNVRSSIVLQFIQARSEELECVVNVQNVLGPILGSSPAVD